MVKEITVRLRTGWGALCIKCAANGRSACAECEGYLFELEEKAEVWRTSLGFKGRLDALVYKRVGRRYVNVEPNLIWQHLGGDRVDKVLG